MRGSALSGRLGASDGSDQRRVPVQGPREVFDGAQGGGADVVFHALDIVEDHVVRQPEQLEEIGEQLMPPGDVARERFAGGGEAPAPGIFRT